MDIRYDRHSQEWEKCLKDPYRERVASSWMLDNTLDRWRHRRMISPINYLVQKGSSWLTVGDGRFGSDAHYLMQMGAQVTASDISDTLLRKAFELKYISDYSQENAEFLSFSSCSFDYVFIKEALHHCPRPWIALYEAFRVCKKAVIIVEPNDDITASLFFKLYLDLKSRVKSLLGKGSSSDRYTFEPVGNFVFGFNRREIEKFLLSMHYQYASFLFFNDSYIPGVEFIDLSTTDSREVAIIENLQNSIQKKDLLCSLGLSVPTMLSSILFKEDPNKITLDSLSKVGWNHKCLPRNPYLNP